MTEQSPGEAADPFDGRDWSTPTADEQGRVRVRRRTRRSPRRRAVVLTAGLFLLVVAAVAAWLAYDGIRTRSELNAVRSAVPKLRAEIAAGDLAAARNTAHSLRADADAARTHADSAVWSFGQHLPVVGGGLSDARRLTRVVGTIADRALAPLADAASVLDPRTLREPDGSVDLPAIQRVAPSLAGAYATLRAATAQVSRLPPSRWSSITAAQHQLAAQLPGLTGTVRLASLAARVVPQILGADGPKNYMISFENEAEMRGGGGLPGAFGILHVDHGKLSFSRFEADTYLADAHAAGVDLGGSFRSIYGGGHFGPTDYYGNSNLSPHFPYAARIWLGMWHEKTGQTLDGAFAVDPTALSYLLAVSGPVTLADGTVVSAQNVVALTQSTIYTQFPATSQQADRKRFLLEIAEAISSRLLGTQVDTTALVRAAGVAAGQSRLLFWTTDAAVETSIAPLPLSGVEPRTTRPYFRLALWNSTASKLDYYIHASVDWSRTGCGPKRDVTAVVRLTNAAPSGLPRYVLGATADRQFHIPLGDEYLGILVYGTHGATLRSMTVDGKKIQYSMFAELGHPVWSDGEFVPRNKTLTIVYRIREPAGSGVPLVPAQPMVNPMTVTVHDQPCK